jgi:hypothetical protein
VASAADMEMAALEIYFCRTKAAVAISYGKIFAGNAPRRFATKNTRPIPIPLADGCKIQFPIALCKLKQKN